MLQSLSNEYFFNNDNRGVWERGVEWQHSPRPTSCLPPKLTPLSIDYHIHTVSGWDSCPTTSRLDFRCPTHVADFFSTLGFASIVSGMDKCLTTS